MKYNNNTCCCIAHRKTDEIATNQLIRLAGTVHLVLRVAVYAFGYVSDLSACEYKWRRQHLLSLSQWTKPGVLIQRHLFLFFFFFQTNEWTNEIVCCLYVMRCVDFLLSKCVSIYTILNIFRRFFSLNIKIYEALRESICLYLTARKLFHIIFFTNTHKHSGIGK